MPRIIAHLDMDAFFAAVEERYNPHLAGKPVVIGADPKNGRGRGVVSTANYLARRYGIRSAMPITKAWELAEIARKRGEPPAIFLGGNYQFYSDISKRIMARLSDAVDIFEEASVDEAYLDLSSLESFDKAKEKGEALKREILAEEGLTCSVGIGPNKLIAKIASDFKKPDGLTVIKPEIVQSFLDPFSIRVIPGIGPKTEKLLNQKGIIKIEDLREIPEQRLTEWLGSWGSELYQKARGFSDNPVSNEGEVKSIGAQETFEVDSLDPSFILGRAKELTNDVFRRFKREEFASFKTITVTVRFSHFVTVSRARSQSTASQNETVLWREVIKLLLPFFDRRENPRQKKIRLIGVRLEKLSR